MNETLLAKLRKLEALATAGVGGERDNAQCALEAFRKKHGELLKHLEANARLSGLTWACVAMNTWALGERTGGQLYDVMAMVKLWRFNRWEWCVDEDMCKAERYSGEAAARNLAMEAAEQALNVGKCERPDDEAAQIETKEQLP